MSLAIYFEKKAAIMAGVRLESYPPTGTPFIEYGEYYIPPTQWVIIPSINFRRVNIVFLDKGFDNTIAVRGNGVSTLALENWLITKNITYYVA